MGLPGGVLGASCGLLGLLKRETHIFLRVLGPQRGHDTHRHSRDASSLGGVGPPQIATL